MTRKLLQFRLRTLLVAMTLLGGMGGWLANYSIGFRHEQQIIESLFAEIGNQGITQSYEVENGICRIRTDASKFM